MTPAEKLDKKNARALRWEIDPEGERAKEAKYRLVQRSKASFPEYNRKSTLAYYHKHQSYRSLMIRLRSYGLTLDQFHSLMEKQDFLCAICGSEESGRKDSWLLYVDHNHKTYQIRGLLCHGCNVGLGGFADDPERLRKAIAYLEYHRTRSTVWVVPSADNGLRTAVQEAAS